MGLLDRDLRFGLVDPFRILRHFFSGQGAYGFRFDRRVYRQWFRLGGRIRLIVNERFLARQLFTDGRSASFFDWVTRRGVFF